PEAHGFTVPAWHGFAEAWHAAGGNVIHLELAAYVDTSDEVVGNAAEHLHHVGRCGDVLFPDRERVPAAHETFGPAERRGPECMTAPLVISLLHHALLVFRRHQRQHGGVLRVPQPVPGKLGLAGGGTRVHAVPFGGREILEGVFLRAATTFRFFHQRVVVLF